MNGSAMTLAAIFVGGFATSYGASDVMRALAPVPVSITALSYDPATGWATYHPRAVGYSEAEPLPGTWRASLSQVGLPGGTRGICSGSDTGFYWDRGQPITGWTLRDLVDEDCPAFLGTGSYRLLVQVTPMSGRPDLDYYAFTVGPEK